MNSHIIFIVVTILIFSAIVVARSVRQQETAYFQDQDQDQDQGENLKDGTLITSQATQINKASGKKYLNLPSNPRTHPVVGQKRAYNEKTCHNLCEFNGDCHSPAFFECLNQQPNNFGIVGRKHAAFDNSLHRTEYNMLTSIAI